MHIVKIRMIAGMVLGLFSTVNLIKYKMTGCVSLLKAGGTCGPLADHYVYVMWVALTVGVIIMFTSIKRERL